MIDLALLASKKHPKPQFWSAGHLDVTVPHRLAAFSEECASSLPTVSIVHRPPRTTCHPRPRQRRGTWANDSLNATTSVTYMSKPSLHTWNISGRPASVEKSTDQTLAELCSSRNSSTFRMVVRRKADQKLSSGLDRTPRHNVRRIGGQRPTWRVPFRWGRPSRHSKRTAKKQGLRHTRPFARLNFPLEACRQQRCATRRATH